MNGICALGLRFPHYSSPRIGKDAALYLAAAIQAKMISNVDWSLAPRCGYVLGFYLASPEIASLQQPTSRIMLITPVLQFRLLLTALIKR